ncbi:protein vav-like [Anthonomus grandis grandis]|uniref:protein vav-like n=1 Tax=Anthonomus grandis grandis TaxID=2921223 RepID=UPI002166B942|nr:protein vav-like [Anthonomus grandis grandis]
METIYEESEDDDNEEKEGSNDDDKEEGQEEAKRYNKNKEVTYNYSEIKRDVDSFTKALRNIEDTLLTFTSTDQFPLKKKVSDYVINELLDTERNYVNLLYQLKMSFVTPLYRIMRTEDHHIIFHNIKELYDIHLAFLIALNKKPSNLSRVFQQFKEQFLIYGEYCANLSKATAVLQQLRNQDAILNQTLIKYEKDVCDRGKFKLQDMLLVPVQRILKYHLLLEKLVENTEEHHKDYLALKEAWEDMKDVAAYINETNRDCEHFDILNHLQGSITGWDNMKKSLSEYGKLIKDTELTIKLYDDHKYRKRHIFIFDKCILICKIRNHQYIAQYIFSMSEYHVEESPLVTGRPWCANNFLLVKNEDIFHTVYVKNIYLKNQIIDAINEAQDNIQPKDLCFTYHKFVMHKFQKPATCLHCRKYLKGLIRQGYLCQMCDSAVHKECIQFSGMCSKSLELPEWDDSLRNRLWFVGKMDRMIAENHLEHKEDGTFLVRIDTMKEHLYVITLKADGLVEHMRILFRSNQSGDSKEYYLSTARFFSNIEEMIGYSE